MLTHDAELNAGVASNGDHLGRRFQVDGHRFLHEHMLAILRAEFDRFEAITGEGTDVEIIDVGALGKLLRRGYKLGAEGFGKLAPLLFSAIGARGYFVADV